ncbi:MAG: sterol desaturase family protein [Methylococcaceae bacterium]
MLSTFVSSTTFLEPLGWSLFLPGRSGGFILLLFFCLLAALEIRISGKKSVTQPLRSSYRTNISLFLFNSAVMSLLSVSSLALLAQRYSDQGLLSYMSSPLLKAMLSFLLLDGLLYVWHKACHRFDWLWLFHKVHHNDRYLNVSTAFRIHILELLMTTILKAAFIVAVGIDGTMLLSYEVIYPFFCSVSPRQFFVQGRKLAELDYCCSFFTPGSSFGATK